LDVERKVLQTLRLETGLHALEFDRDGDVAVRFGNVPIWISVRGVPRHVRIRSTLVAHVEESKALLFRLNELNAGLTRLHLYFRDERIGAVTDVAAEPFEPAHLVRALREFGELGESFAHLLQAEFGGQSAFGDAMPSISKH
jgi:hypothetical protein